MEMKRVYFMRQIVYAGACSNLKIRKCSLLQKIIQLAEGVKQSILS